jgi:threonine/homoserine/homoserine lactone efflux protein
MSASPDPSQVIAFVTFSAVVSGTPGPSNTLLTAIGAKAGIRRGLPSLLGQATGMAAMLCWLAVRIALAAHTEDVATRPTGFLGMAAFQWVNPKGWLISVAAVGSFLTTRAAAAVDQAAVLAVLFLVTALPSCFPWLAFGAVLRRFLASTRAWLIVRYATAALLLASVVLLPLPSP